MSGGAAESDRVVLETERLLLRPWRVHEASVQREMWIERDPRGATAASTRMGTPSADEFEEAIRADGPSSVRLLAVGRKVVGDTIGYCGLVDGGHGAHGPELAFEFLRRFWG